MHFAVALPVHLSQVLQSAVVNQVSQKYCEAIFLTFSLTCESHDLHL